MMKPSLAFLALAATTPAQQPAAIASPAAVPPTPIEFGTVAWQRDFAAATDLATQRDLPLLVLFQEVPG